MNKDLTMGKPSEVLVRFCMPLFGSVIFQQLYNLADSFVAGKFIGENALAAVGNSYEITLIFIAVSFGCNMGCSVVASRLFGAKEYNTMKTAIYTALFTTAGICAVLMLGGALLCAPLLRWMNTPASIFADSKLYLEVYILGLPFVFFYNVANGIFSALGDSKTPFCFLAVSSTANIAVDILFVTALDMGVAGVAWATFLCQGISCALALAVVFCRLRAIPVAGKKPALFSQVLLGQLAAIAVPSMLQQSFISVGNIVIQTVINGFGASVIAGYAAAVKLNNLVITSFTTIGNGVSNYTAQNLGAERPLRVREGFRAAVKMVWLICIPAVLLYFGAGRLLLRMFMEDAGGLALQTGLNFLRILSPFYFIISVKLMADGTLRGSGMMKHFMISTFTDLLMRVTLAVLLAGTALGATGIWCAWPISWLAGTVLSYRFYRSGPWWNLTADTVEIV